MQRTMLKSKIQPATVTDANLHYEGSITIDALLMDKANLLPFEKVHVFNVNSGARFETYVIQGEAGSGTVCVNGAAARLVQIGDKVIVVSYAVYDDERLAGHEPIVVKVDESNAVRRETPKPVGNKPVQDAIVPRLVTERTT